MIGQQNLLTQINKYTSETFPHSFIIVGDKGSGKHTLLNEISKKLNIEVFDITDKISEEFLDEVRTQALQFIYVCNANELVERNQNIILKFLEEPPANAYVVILCENKANLLSTIVNRCVVFEIEHYTKDDLISFMPDTIKASPHLDLLINVCNTPGKIKELEFITNPQSIVNAYELSNKIISSMSKANFSNALSISKKIDFDEKDFDKFTLNMFINAFIFALFEDFKKTNKRTSYEMYQLAINEKKKLRDKRINKQQFVDNLLIQLWQLAQGK